METWRQINYELPASEYFVYRDDHASNRITRNAEQNLLVQPLPGGAGAELFIRQGTSLWNGAPAEIRDEKKQLRKRS